MMAIAVKRNVKEIFNKYTIYFIFVVIFLLLSFGVPGFLTRANLINVLLAESSRGVLGIGVTLVLISKGYDLSVAANMAMSGIVTASLVQSPEYAARILPNGVTAPIAIAILAGLSVGVVVGLINGFLIAYRKLPPFIATLGTSTALAGIAMIYTNSYPVPMLDEGFKKIGQARAFGIIPLVIIYFAVIAFIAWVILNKTRFGKRIYAVGCSESAARVAGINVEATRMRVYVWSGIVSSMAGIMMTARSGSGMASMGEGYQLDVIAACVVGGVSNSGGIGKIGGVILGILLIGILNNGLLLLGANPYIQQVIRGLVILVAVLFDLRKLAKKQ